MNLYTCVDTSCTDKYKIKTHNNTELRKKAKESHYHRTAAHHKLNFARLV